MTTATQCANVCGKRADTKYKRRSPLELILTICWCLWQHTHRATATWRVSATLSAVFPRQSNKLRAQAHRGWALSMLPHRAASLLPSPGEPRRGLLLPSTSGWHSASMARDTESFHCLLGSATQALRRFLLQVPQHRQVSIVPTGRRSSANCQQTNGQVSHATRQSQHTCNQTPRFLTSIYPAQQHTLKAIRHHAELQAQARRHHPAAKSLSLAPQAP